jgi:hypothetical protein
MIRILRLCKKWNIILRVIEGTPSHDRKQPGQFRLFNESIQANFKYFDGLHLEYIPELDINVLYLSDEYRGDTSQTQKEVNTLLAEHQLTQVDFTIMHGAYKHQVPNVKHMQVHDHEFYLRITKKYIFIGHIHTASQYNRILAQGSFDRLAHNEESPKGFFHVKCYEGDTTNDVVTFCINHNAAIYKTVDVCNLLADEVDNTLADLVDIVTKANTDYSIPIHIRVVCEKNDKNEVLINTYRKVYHQIKWSIKIRIDKQEQPLGESIAPTVYKAAPISSSTIVPMIRNRLNALGVEEALVIATLDILNEIKNI